MNRAWVLGLGAMFFVLLMAGCSWQGSLTPPGQAALAEIDKLGLAALQAEFNRSPGGVRVILLLSPT